MTLKIHSTYEISSKLICHLCSLHIPVNVFRGSINGRSNRLALQIDHVVPKALGGSDDPSNLKPAHSFCNGSKNKFTWTETKKENAFKVVSSLLSLSLDEAWTLRRLSNVCIFEHCSKVARAGDFWQYCVKHARYMGENPRVNTCKEYSCSKQARSKAEGYCSNCAKLNGVVSFFENCFIEDCSTKARMGSGGEYFCQKHGRERGLAHSIESGVRDKASHLARHKHPSRGCYFCVEVESRSTYLDLSEISENDKNLSLRKFREKYNVSARFGQHFLDLIQFQHLLLDCKWCVFVASMRK